MFKRIMTMLEGLNAMSLALGVIIGGAIGKVVGSLTSDVLMPLLSLVIPGGAWRELQLVLRRADDGAVVNAIKLGTFLGTLLDFLIIAYVVQLLSKALVKPQPAAAAAPAPATKSCGECGESVLAVARKCRFCASAV